MAQLKATAERYGLPMGLRKTTFNSRLAQEVGLWADTQKKGHAFHMAAFQAYFVEGRNLALKEVILDLAAQSGLDVSAAEAVVDQRSFSRAVDLDWDLARQKGVTAVPTFFFGPGRLVGAHPYEALLGLVDRGGGISD